MGDSDQREAEERGIDELRDAMVELAMNSAGRARRFLQQLDEAEAETKLLKRERDEAQVERDDWQCKTEEARNEALTATARREAMRARLTEEWADIIEQAQGTTPADMREATEVLWDALKVWSDGPTTQTDSVMVRELAEAARALLLTLRDAALDEGEEADQPSSAMTADECRDWLDARGRRSAEKWPNGWGATLFAHKTFGAIIAQVREHLTELAALRALVDAVREAEADVRD